MRAAPQLVDAVAGTRRLIKRRTQRWVLRVHEQLRLQARTDRLGRARLLHRLVDRVTQPTKRLPLCHQLRIRPLATLDSGPASLEDAGVAGVIRHRLSGVLM